MAPARKSGGGSGDAHDQIHGSVVATLLALMDGRTGATWWWSRPRTARTRWIPRERPGRFDRELHFSLPGRQRGAGCDCTPANGGRNRGADDRGGGCADGGCRRGGSSRAVRGSAFGAEATGPEAAVGDATGRLAAELEPMLPRLRGTRNCSTRPRRRLRRGTRGRGSRCTSLSDWREGRGVLVRERSFFPG